MKKITEKPLFKTLDGVDMLEGMTYYAVDPKTGEFVKSTADYQSEKSDWLKYAKKPQDNLLKLAEALDFRTVDEYFEYCISSYANGQLTQCKSLFSDMNKEGQKALLNYLNGGAQFNGKLEVRNFYFNLM